MENINQMRKRHKAEKKALEDSCPHEKLSGWMDFAWAPGHFSGRVKVCKNCGKIVERDNKPGPILQHSLDNPPRPVTQKEINDVVHKSGRKKS